MPDPQNTSGQARAETEPRPPDTQPEIQPGTQPETQPGTQPETDAERRRRRAQFLRELNEAKALRDRVQPRRARAARMRQAMRMRTFRW
ncbi:hypothetical protein [Streptomyces sp. CC208A]|uniref:hypothetical protein n=1 Tax=Streptomyces sp. CC208A TaxID=3044573 RepID=UPI0024A9B5E6|nr:hypothetical protein [Streptomyces sp. CC208A]